MLNWHSYLYVLYAELIIIALLSIAGMILNVVYAKKQKAEVTVE